MSERTICLTIKKEIEVAATFPIYRKHELDSCVMYTRWDGEESITVTTSSTGYEIEREPDLGNRLDSPEYALGQGPYQCSAREFVQVLVEATRFLNMITEAVRGG